MHHVTVVRHCRCQHEYVWHHWLDYGRKEEVREPIIFTLPFGATYVVILPRKIQNFLTQSCKLQDAAVNGCTALQLT